MMTPPDIGAESFLFQWNFFERAVSNYSIIIRMLQPVERENGLLANMTRVFVEETIFDSCQIVTNGGGEFFSLEDSLGPVHWRKVEQQKGKLFSPVLLQGEFGYGTLYIYPLKRNVHVFGYLLFGKKKYIALTQAPRETSSCSARL